MILIFPIHRRIHFFCHHDYYVNSKTGLRISHWSFIVQKNLLYRLLLLATWPWESGKSSHCSRIVLWETLWLLQEYRPILYPMVLYLLTEAFNKCRVDLICLHKYLEMKAFPKIAPRVIWDDLSTAYYDQIGMMYNCPKNNYPTRSGHCACLQHVFQLKLFVISTKAHSECLFFCLLSNR